MISGKLVIGAVAALLACSALSGWQGYRMGHAVAEARYNSRLLAEIEAGQKLDEARRVLARQRDDLARQLEEEAHADPVIVERCMSPDRVRRLNTLR